MLTKTIHRSTEDTAMLNKLTLSAVGAAILVTVALASMALLRDRGPMTNQLLGIEPVPSYFNFEDFR